MTSSCYSLLLCRKRTRAEDQEEDKSGELSVFFPPELNNIFWGRSFQESKLSSLEAALKS